MSKELNITQKLAKARVELQKHELKKSGKNKFGNFEYFELKDFLPTVNIIFEKIGLLGVFNLDKINAQLKIINTDKPEEEINFVSPLASLKNVNDKMHDIQKLGSQHTYFKRYLYFNALEIAENDTVDALPQENLATPKQIEFIEKLYGDRVEGMLEYFGINSLSELSEETASQLIEIEQNKETEVKKQPEPKKNNLKEQVNIEDL